MPVNSWQISVLIQQVFSNLADTIAYPVVLVCPHYKVLTAASRRLKEVLDLLGSHPNTNAVIHVDGNCPLGGPAEPNDSTEDHRGGESRSEPSFLFPDHSRSRQKSPSLPSAGN